MQDSQKLDIKIEGLYTSPNNLSSVPPGALEIADNVVIASESIVDSRRGQTQYGSPLTIGSGQVNKIFNYASSLISNYDDKMAYDSGSGVWVEYPGDYLAPSAAYKMRSLEAQKNFYFTTSLGVYKLDALTSVPRTSGAPRGLGGEGSVTGATGFLAANSAVAYRILWGYRDFNNNLIIGAPSSRVIVANTGGTSADVDLEFSIPASVTTEYFYQIYRSLGTATATDEPTDELQLVLEGNPTIGEVVARVLSVQDQTPESLMGATLYTSPSQEGIAQSNFEPPFCVDMDVFKGSAFYANIRQKGSLVLTLISVDSPSLGYVSETGDTTSGSAVIESLSDTTVLRVGMRAVGAGIPSDTVIESIDSGTQVTLSNNASATATGVAIEFQDRVSIALVDYWAGSTQDVLTNTFEVENGGTPGQNIAQTSLNFLDIVNRSVISTVVYGYYLSGPEDLPGQMQFVERSFALNEDFTFFATSTAGSSFTPVLPEAQSISTISVADPTVITSSANHGLSSGDIVHIYSSNSTPSVNGEWEVTVISPTTFSIPIEVTVSGSFGYFIPDAQYVVSTNDAQQNRVAVSKPGQVEAVPVLNFFDIGSANFPIQRVVALRDGIFFFKPDGIFRLSGENIENFTVNPVDNTTALKAPESAIAFNNQVFCFTDQGVCAVTDSGVQIMSVPIENTLLRLSSEQFVNFAGATFGVAYESARQYMLFTVTDEDDEFATQAFVYNSLTNTWTRWIMNRTCGVVNTSINKLFMAETDSGQILIERKSYTNADYADEQYSVTISAVDSDTEITLSSVTNVEVGMTISQDSRNAVILEINGTDLVITPVNGLVAGVATVYTPIENRIQWAPIDAENPGLLKQFSEISLFFRNAAFAEIFASFSTNISLSTEIVPIQNISSDGWGRRSWGRFPWGSPRGGQNVLRTYVPREKQRGSWLILSLRTYQAFTGFSLQGVSIMLNTMSSRFK